MQYPFTVKIQEFNGGETILPASCVEAMPSDPDAPSHDRAPIVCVVIRDLHSDEPPHEVHNGAVFVMNELGTTVARYRLPAAKPVA
jgi:hypothetical protein